MTDCVVGLVTCASRAQARKVAKAILTKRLAACVNIVDGLESHYWWKGKLERAGECLLVIKTTRTKSRALTAAVKSAHSYEVPEVILLPVAAGERNYLKWVRDSVKKLTAIVLLVFSASAVGADPIEDLIRQLGHAEEEMRAEAAEKLSEIGGPRVEKQFRQMLGSANPEHRQMAVVGLLKVSDEDADLQRVRERLKDESSTVRWSAALALGQSGRAEAIAWLEEAAQTDASESVREAAAEAAAKLRAGIRWRRVIGDALQQARALNKPVFAYFRLNDSLHCRRFEEGVLSDPAVVDATEQFVPLRVDVSRCGDDARRLDVRGAPTILILDGQGNEMLRLSGVVDKPTLLARLAEVRRGQLTFRQARRQASRDPADVQANWKVAETYLEQGREDLAEPFLRNVIAHDEQNRHGYTDNAMFALAFALGKRGEYAQAVYGFERLLARWPGFKDKDKALYCLGLSHLALGDKDRARAALEQLTHEFPQSSTLRSARQALEKLNANNR